MPIVSLLSVWLTAGLAGIGFFGGTDRGVMFGNSARSQARRRDLSLGAAVTVIAGGLVAMAALPAAAAGGTGVYADWNHAAGAGSIQLATNGFGTPSASFTTDASSVSVASGASAFLGASTPFGAAYGSSQGRPYLVAGTAAGQAPSATNYTFANPTPVGTWGFALGDIDADKVTVTAVKADGTQATASDLGFQAVFNYCNNSPKPSSCPAGPATDVPTWNPATQELIGNVNDTAGAAGWFQPTVSLTSLRLTFTRLSGIPVYQTWFAGDVPAAPTNQLTLVARECDDYPDVMANKARNNIMESLQDLGPDSIYPSKPAPLNQVNPTVETEIPSQNPPTCRPLTGWKFALGDRINGQDTGPYGRLSRVGSPDGFPTTAALIPELNAQGNPTGGSVAGAVTVGLTDAQLARATQGKLWVQGGVPGQPLNGESDIAFATLRCAVDNTNADNVETARYANGARHVYCYAYYIRQTPASGTIIIRKQEQPIGSGTSFGFTGDLSFNANGAFSLVHGGSATFTRQSGLDWTVIETPQDPFVLQDIDCQPLGPGSSVAKNLATGTAVIQVGAGETVDCTYINELAPTSRLAVAKQVLANNAEGLFLPGPLTFGGTVAGPQPTPNSWTAEVSDAGTPVVDDLGTVASGDYTIDEAAPTAIPGGAWTTPAYQCVAKPIAGGPSTVTTSGSGYSLGANAAPNTDNLCLFSNTFVPNGKVTVRSKILGGSGAANAESSYTLTSPSQASTNLLDPGGQATVLTNTVWGDPGLVTNPTLSGLDLTTYTLTGVPPNNSPGFKWRAVDLACSGGVFASVDEDTGVAKFGLAAGAVDTSEVACTYTWERTKEDSVLTLQKLVTAGNDLRTGVVTVELDCTASHAAQPSMWPVRVTVPVGAQSAGTQVNVPGASDTGLDTCTATEVATGAPPPPSTPGQIAATWNGAAWPASTVNSLTYGTSAAVAATATSASPVSRSTFAPCAFGSGRLWTTSGTGACRVRFTANGNPTVAVTTTHATNGGAAQPGTQVAVDIDPDDPALNSQSIEFVDSYTSSAPTLVADRFVKLAKASKPPIVGPPVTTIPPGGITVVVPGSRPPNGYRLDYKIACGPMTRGELRYCTATVGPGGKVLVRTYGYHGIRVVLTITAVPLAGQQNNLAPTKWTHAWYIP